MIGRSDYAERMEQRFSKQIARAATSYSDDDWQEACEPDGARNGRKEDACESPEASEG
jgi:hypothetical protein